MVWALGTDVVMENVVVTGVEYAEPVGVNVAVTGMVFSPSEQETVEVKVSVVVVVTGAAFVEIQVSV
jgi:hypothetical protein